jgi:Fur family transcriptional regulator, ferric uptake regulator
MPTEAEAETELAGVLRAKGLRMTAQRQLVLEAVRALGHATPEQIHERIRGQVEGVNITTVYRALDLLEELQLVSHTHLSHGAPTYHLSGDRGHAHITEVDPSLFANAREEVADNCGFVMDIGHVAVFGTCAECLENER